MARSITYLQQNEFYTFEVIEVLNDKEILIGIEGKLHRVKNLTSKKVKAGQKIKLQVTQADPLEFSWGSPPLNRFERVI